MSTAARAVLILWLVALATGCAASGKSAGVGPQPVPLDFSLNLVRIGEEGEVGRFILWCDGSLYWDRKEDRQENRMPGLRRVLSRVEMRDFWLLVQELDMDQRMGALRGSPLRVQVQRDGELHDLTLELE